MRVVVAIHDVTPAHDVAVRRLWSLCRERAVLPALLVVPNWHGSWPLDEHSRFVGWLADAAREGAEIVLHGERHDEVGNRRGWREQVAAWGRTDREGEFLALDYEAALARIARGTAVLSGLGLGPSGFVPPAWLAREDTFCAAAAANLGFAEDASSIRLLGTGARLTAPAIRWSARSRARAIGSVAVAGARWRLHRRRPLIRLALHPQDLAHPATARSLVRALDRWLATHRPVRYGDL
jgi:uncharacterized protein